jgi:hypothetical protein
MESIAMMIISILFGMLHYDIAGRIGSDKSFGL